MWLLRKLPGQLCGLGLWEPADCTEQYCSPPCSLTVLSTHSAWNLAGLAQHPQESYLLDVVERGQAGLGSNPSSVID